LESKNYTNEYFDIVYIDASHEYEYVKEDILAWLPKVKKGGIICGDDYIIGWDGVILAVNEIFKDKVNIVGKQQWWVLKE
jgi:predicted O-methyltransferase YrrM